MQAISQRNKRQRDQIATFLSYWGLLFIFCFLASPSYSKNNTGLLPQQVFLSKSQGQKPRELYITVINSSNSIFKNEDNPITVLINGIPYFANIFAKKYSDRYYKWADIRPHEEGAIFIRFPNPPPYLAWSQCEKLKIVIDPEGKIKRGGSPLIKGSTLTYTLLLHDKDYHSDCRYVSLKDKG